MPGISVRHHIAAPPDVVFARAADFEHAADFISGITKVEMVTDGPVGVGTRFKETRVMFGKEHAEEMEVVDFEPPRRYALQAHNCGCRYHTEFRFTPKGGGTEIEMTFDATPLTFVARIMSFMMRFMMKSCVKMVEKDLADLKQAIESPPDGSRPSPAMSPGS